MYLIQTPHTQDECLKALDEQAAKGPENLKKFHYACKSGDHTGYAIVDAMNSAEARAMVPAFLQNKARISEVTAFTPEMIRSLHTKVA